MPSIIRKAFTLIELLVVIAIIGILSGLIVVSMSGVNDKAKIAKAQVFSNSLRNSLMSDFISEWKFDIDGSDTWGSNSFTLYGSTIGNSDCINGSCLSLTGQVSSYTIKNPYSGFPATEFTFETWFKTSCADADQDGIISYATSHSDNDILIHYPSRLTIYIYANAINTTLKMNDGKWHHIAFSWISSSGDLKFYADGSPKSYTLSVGASLLDNGSLVFGQDQDLVGGGFETIQAFSGSIDESRLYKKVISMPQIKEHYFAGLRDLLANNSISLEEYNSRIEELSSIDF